MLIQPSILGDIITPFSVHEFFELHWKKKPLFIQNRPPECYQKWFSFKDLEKFVKTKTAIHPDNILAAKNGQALAQDKYMAKGHVDWEQLFLAHDHGYTIILNKLDCQISTLEALSDYFEQIFKSPVNINLYLTPRSSQGFMPHFDAHQVFILQIAGSKNWCIYDHIDKVPEHARDNLNDKLLKEYLSDDTKSLQLQPGDLLYIPDGFVHEAFSTPQQFSLHLNVGIKLTTER